MRGMGNMQGMMQKMQKMQKQLVKEQEELNKTEFVGQSQSDLVQVTMNGKHEVVKVALKQEAVDPEDLGMLEDLIQMAVNDAVEKVQKANEQRMGKYTKGLNIPGF
ncbi:YbaB/EbfC family nucleoid-associated protein [Atopobacter sp. AH10]|uniref:YbaB/EbfC family nucleoid-associated protein n=1 Tax=Atopobacter sp. AH10 TaxID=2315861 RepID=UPI000EF1EFE2|nr:YbaB/EbfC family nucleoid-associated protein [Atopobacter sp. AH10]RLK62762.1 YbaB/EbfC family nucleoid-associated protein [Atopobacter sp. AH10]